jgi:hypothetical protein
LPASSRGINRATAFRWCRCMGMGCRVVETVLGGREA